MIRHVGIVTVVILGSVAGCSASSSPAGSDGQSAGGTANESGGTTNESGGTAGSSGGTGASSSGGANAGGSTTIAAGLCGSASDHWAGICQDGSPSGGVSVAGVAVAIDGTVVFGGDTNGALGGGAKPTVGPQGAVGYVASYGASGKFAWATTLAPASGFDPTATNAVDADSHVYDVAVDSKGHAVFVGATNGAFPGENLTGNFYDAFVGEVDGMGNVLWLHSFGNANATLGSASASEALQAGLVNVAYGVAVGTDDSVVLVGNYSLESSGTLPRFVAKYDSNGNQLWLKTQTDVGSSPGRTLDVALDRSGNAYVLGYTGVDTQREVAKFDANGNATWKATHESPLGRTMPDEQRIAVTPDGSGIFFAGSEYGSSGSLSGYWASVKSDGSAVTANPIALGKGESSTSGAEVVTDGTAIYLSGSYGVPSTTTETPFLTAIDVASGNTTWTQVFDQKDAVDLGSYTDSVPLSQVSLEVSGLAIAPGGALFFAGATAAPTALGCHCAGSPASGLGPDWFVGAASTTNGSLF
ncbi:MAG TPA: hypothetical protein VH142_25985 [Polyangiaceae bacterium]|jgi:hypothetical protein|nr:hypothetical protein [Polyangiaceae bacterium]